ncbi:MAG: antibiotic ABC transporter ATP-binding protein [Bacteroidetes bacterium]|nr:MAG: antibiotic ABC transporter ATP-binding protein [Bacteroidota bacterium]
MRSLGTIFHYIRRYPKLVTAYFLFNVLSTIFSLVSLTLLSPFLMLIFNVDSGVKNLTPSSNIITGTMDQFKNVVRAMTASPEGKIRALGLICLVVILAVLLKNIFYYLAMYVLNPIRNRILNDMRADMFNKILNLPIGYFNEQRKGDIMSRLTNDLQDVEFSTVSFLESFFREPITIIVFLAYMISTSPQLSLFLLIFLPVSGLIIGRIGRSLKRVSTRVQEKLSSILTIIDETLGGMRIVKGFNAEDQQSLKFNSANEDLLHIKNKANRRRDMASPVSELLGVTAVCCVLYYGGRLVLKNEGFSLSGTDFLAYIAVFTQIINPLKTLSAASYNIRKGAASIERIQTLIKEQESIREIPSAKPIKSFVNEIEFRNVNFYYGDKPILKNINLKIQKGKTIAIVGSSGAGKSTLADLVPRFHDVTGGELLIDGENIKNYKLKDLRELMGIVTQEPILFNDTIANNIALGKPLASKAEIEKAAKIANAHNFIIHKEGGYDSNIGDRGSKLSGGERQRLTIARAVLKNPPILILDEATSSLDTESERLVQDAINHLMANRTSIVIAHRLSTVRHADEIIVLQKGEIVERGTHDSLLGLDGMYRKLVEMQEVK